MQVCPLENRLYSGKERVSNTRQLIAFKACHLLGSFAIRTGCSPPDHATPPFQICAFVQNQVNCLSVEFSIRRRKLLYSVLIFQSSLQLSSHDTSRAPPPPLFFLIVCCACSALNPFYCIFVLEMRSGYC